MALLKADVDFSNDNPYEGQNPLGTLLICPSSTFYTGVLKKINNEI
jgi:hypothetical protein